jgi:hypothetical protein
VTNKSAEYAFTLINEPSNTATAFLDILILSSHTLLI